MKATRLTVAVTVLAIALTGFGCKKKEPSGTTEGMTPPSEQTESGAERVDKTRPAEAPLESGVEESDIGGPLKDVYFDFDRYEIRPDQRAALEANARWLSANGGQSVILEGHCDERGTEEYNLALGDRRANAVKSYLQALGIAPSRMQTLSYGEAYPVDPRSNEEAWAKNRRVHFTMVPPKTGSLGGAR